MPLIRIQAEKEVSSTVLAALSKIAAETIGKPETCVMVCASKADVMMSGSTGDAAFVEVKSIGGLSRHVNERLSGKICDLLNEKLAIPSDRVYLNYVDVPAAHWGWNGALFG